MSMKKRIYIVALLMVFGVRAETITVDLQSVAKAQNPKDKPHLFGMYPDKTGVKVLNKKASFPVAIGRAGTYKIWVKFYTVKDRYSNLALRIDAPTKEPIRYERIDFMHGLPLAKVTASKEIVREAGIVWHAFEQKFEYPGEYLFFVDHVAGAARQKGWHPAFHLEGVWLSDDMSFDPRTGAPAKATASAPKANPAGFVPAREHPLHASLNSGITDEKKRFKSTVHQNYPVYFNPALLIDVGCTFEQNHYNLLDDRGFGLKGGHGLQSRPNHGLYKKYPNPKKGETFNPVGRKANADGKYWNDWSDSFAEANASAYSNDLAEVKKVVEGPLNNRTDNWAVAWEHGGTYDYGETSVAAYRVYLKEKYGTIDSLNQAWRTTNTSFEAINPAKRDDCVGEKKLEDPFKRAQETANFIDFRDFCSKEYAKVVARRVKAAKTDPLKRPITAQFANLDLNAVEWSGWRPLNIEDLLRIGLKEADVFGYDVYGVDDWVGAEYDTFASFGDEKKCLMIREGSTHTPDPDLAARSYWTAVGKGLKGFSHFMLQEGNNHAEFPKFGLTNFDGSPRPKLAAYSDAIRAMHHVENVLADAKRVHAVKPVAIYYSRTCNALQERSHSSLFDCGPDSPFRVYELMRGNGYPVTFITDTQIRDGKLLNDIAGIFFIDAKYIPTDVLEKVELWVEKGGAVFADAQPGIYDGHGFPQDRFIKWLGIEPIQAKKVDRLAADKNPFGYSAASFDVVNADKLHLTQFEFFQQWDSDHPIARAVGKFMFSGYGHQRVKAVDGEVIAMAHGGAPAAVVRTHGKGSSCYFAGYFGSIYGGAASHYEWRDAHSDPSPYRFMDAYLAFIGAKKSAVSDQPQRVRTKMRFESPLVDSRGNAILPMTSYNDDVLRPFKLSYKMAPGMKSPRALYALVNNTRQVMPLAFTEKDGVLSFEMPAFRTFALVLALNEAEPVVSVDFGDTPRGEAGLVDLKPGQEVAVKVKVLNPSARALAPGKLTVRLPKGWYYDRETVDIPAIPAGGESSELTFKIRTPDVCAATRFRPINFIYENIDNIKSMPTVEMVWWR